MWILCMLQIASTCLICIMFVCCLFVCLFVCRDDVILCPYEAELVHDIIDSDEGRCTDDEEDSNG